MNKQTTNLIQPATLEEFSNLNNVQRANYLFATLYHNLNKVFKMYKKDKTLNLEKLIDEVIKIENQNLKVSRELFNRKFENDN